MAGTFFRVFMITLISVALLFLLLYWISHLLKGWTAGEVFIQMTNPSPTRRLMDSSEWMLIIAVNLFGMFVVNGVLLTILLNWLTNRRQRYLNGEARYGLMKSSTFSVIIGSHPIAARLASIVMERDKAEYVFIMTGNDPEELRRQIHSIIPDRKQAANVIIYNGNSNSWHELKELQANRSKGIYIIGDEHGNGKVTNDARNLKCWQILRRNITEPRNIKLPCHILIEDPHIFHIFQTTDLDLDDTRTFRFIPFNKEQCWARTTLAGLPDVSFRGTTRYLPLDGEEGIGYDNPQRVHLIISGCNRQALAMMIECAQLAHYPNFLNPLLGHPGTRITVIDPNIRTLVEKLRNRLPGLFSLVRWSILSPPSDPTMGNRYREYGEFHNPKADFGYLGENLTDIEFEFIEGDLEISRVREYLLQQLAPESNDKSELITMAICDDDDNAAVRKAISLPDQLYEQCLRILVQQHISADIIDGLRNGRTGKGYNRFASLQPFGMHSETDYLCQFEELLPKYVNFAYTALSRGSSFIEEYERCDTLSEFNTLVNREWLSMEQQGGKTCIAKRWSNLYSADNFHSKWRAAKNLTESGKVISDSVLISRLARTEHNRWVMEQLLLGMRPPGPEYAGRLPIEDRTLRTELKSHGIHPDLIANEMLGSTAAYDEEIVKLIPFMLRLYETSDQS